jgi:hypothetical protein
MKSPPALQDEKRRLGALGQHEVLNKPLENAIADFPPLAAQCDNPRSKVFHVAGMGRGNRFCCGGGEK